jgi:hypothetical protein
MQNSDIHKVLNLCFYNVYCIDESILKPLLAGFRYTYGLTDCT